MGWGWEVSEEPLTSGFWFRQLGGQQGHLLWWGRPKVSERFGEPVQTGLDVASLRGQKTQLWPHGPKGRREVMAQDIWKSLVKRKFPAPEHCTAGQALGSAQGCQL